MDETDDFWPTIPQLPRSDPPVTRSIHGAYHALNRRIQAAAWEHGVGTSEALVLAYLIRDPGCASAVVRHTFGFHRSTLASLLDRLERDGMVERARTAFDGRRLELHLTKRGSVAAETADLLIGDIEAELRDYTSIGERQAAAAVYEALVAMNRPGERIQR